MKTTSLTLCIIAAAFALAGCDQTRTGSSNAIDGKVVSVGVRHLMLDDGDSIMFVPIDENERTELKGLKKGDKVQLIGHRVPDATAKGGMAMEVDEIVTAAGKHVTLNH